MINFDSLTLKLFYEENKDFFTGSRIRKIQQPNRHELIFLLRNKKEQRKFYINFNPDFYHLCFMSKENEEKRNIQIPKTAPMFCMLLRKYIQNALIVNVEVPKYERIFEIYFEYYDELNEKSKLCLAIELMGRYSNVILYNYDTNVIIGCAHNVSSEKSRERELYGMLPYVYPPKQKKKDINKVSFESFEKSIITDKDFDSENEKSISSLIVSKYNYLTIPIVNKIKNSITPFSFEKLYEELKNFLNKHRFEPHISNDYSEYFLFEFKNSFKINSINEMLDNYFAFHQESYLKSGLKSKILKCVNNKLLKLNNLKEKQEQQIQKLDKAVSYKNKADIITANLYLLKSGQKIANLTDFEGNNIEIELDENISPIQNANKYYSLYKKIKTAYEHALEMLKDTKSQIMYYEEQKFYTENSSNINELKDIYVEINEEQEEHEEKKQNIEYVEQGGFKIYIGKNKKQNDYILSKLSSAEDIWFHPLNAAGAHILVKNPEKVKIPDDVLLKAAKITKEYSSQKNNSKTSIIYTKRKYVKKANNKVAFVTYKNETEIIV